MSYVRKEELADGIVLYQGDCRDILPTLGTVDAVVTDPVWPNAPYGMFPVDDPQMLLAEALDCIRCTRLAIIMRTDSDPRMLSSVPASLKFIRHQNLEYVATGYLGRVLGGMEVVYGFGTPIPSRPGQRVIVGNGPKVQPSERVNHPCPRNLEHMRFVVRWWSEPCECVLDPFMGSGTTGIACVQLGRKFIGIEIDTGYFDIACRRISDELRRPRFDFGEPVKQPTQEALL